MSTGPYDIGPFQELTAINFAEAGESLYVIAEANAKVFQYFEDTDKWIDLEATSRPVTSASGLARDYTNGLMYMLAAYTFHPKVLTLLRSSMPTSPWPCDCILSQVWSTAKI